LLHLAGRKAKSSEAQGVLREASNRVAAMAAAQQVLYGTISARFFNARDFVSAVCGAVKQVLPRDARMQCEADDFELPNDVAMPLALILNELVTNAAKHGADARSGANVRVQLARRNGSFLLEVEDDGPGFDWGKFVAASM
jgi:two-component sensor histidine kinase